VLSLDVLSFDVLSFDVLSPVQEIERHLDVKRVRGLALDVKEQARGKEQVRVRASEGERGRGWRGECARVRERERVSARKRQRTHVHASPYARAKKHIYQFTMITFERDHRSNE